MTPKLSPIRKKSLVYSLSILLVLAFFLSGYFFYYIPRNTKTIQENGFLILETVSGNIENKIAGNLNLYYNLYKTGGSKTGIKKLFDENNMKATIDCFIKNDQSTGKINKLANSSVGEDSLSATIHIGNSRFTYSYKEKDTNDSVCFSESVSDFLDPILSSQKEELFESYALALLDGRNSKLIFYDKDIGIRSDINPDTLFPKNAQAYFPGIVDVNEEQDNHKMFYYPFKVQAFQLVLVGFVPSKRYITMTRNVPFGFIYPLAIAFVLLLVFMPIIKFKVMDSNEQVKIADVFLFGLSAFVGVSILTLFIIHILLWKGEEERVKENLKSLSSQIDSSFTNELYKAYNKLSELDDFRRKNSFDLNTKNNGKINFRDPIREYLKTHHDSSKFYHFDRISWVDTSSGKQVIKAEIYGQPVFTNVHERNYYKQLKDSNPFVLKHDSVELKFGWEPIISWTNGDFNISISKQSDEYMAVLATKMYSVVGTLLPVGYGFCIIDGKGNVQTHSIGSRNLMENIFKKAQPSGTLAGMVAGRQEGFIKDVSLYGKWHLINVQPIKDLPYSIITFYDSGFITPVIMRILIFALLFSFVSTILSIILLVMLSKVAFRHPLLYSPMDFLCWLPPKQKEKNFYFHGLLYLVIYLVILLSSIVLYDSIKISNYTIFSIVLMTPVNVILGLYILSEVFNYVNRATLVNPVNSADQSFDGNYFFTKMSRKFSRLAKFNVKIIYVVVGHLLISTVFYLYSRSSDYNVGIFSFAFQVFNNLLMWVYIFLSGKPNSFFAIKEKSAFSKRVNQFFNYKRSYNLMATFLVICLSVIPSGLYTWYAHNQEIIQSVKKHQLHLANSLMERSNTLFTRNGFNDTVFIPPHYLEQLVFKKGIYTIHNDKINYGEHIRDDSSVQNLRPFETFYFSIADAISPSYYDPQSYPALRDMATDSGWYWQVKDSIHLWYNLPSHFSKSMYIVSTIPARFKFLSLDRIGWLIPFVLFVFLLTWALYEWLRINTKAIFLMNYLNSEKKYDNRLYQFIAGLAKNKNTDLSCIIQDFGCPVNVDKSRYNQLEKELLEKVRNCEKTYCLIWKNCSDKERYLIYDFAFDGLINYKNVPEIYDLISKGIFVADDEKIKLFSAAFRAYVITKTDSSEIEDLREKYKTDSSWELLRRPLMLVLFLIFIATIIFFIQEALFQKLLVLAGGLGTILALLPKYSVGQKSVEESKGK